MVTNILKSYVGMSLGIVFIGIAFVIQICFAFLGTLLCADCGSGDRAVGLCAFVFTLICKFLNNRLLIYLFWQKSIKFHYSAAGSKSFLNNCLKIYTNEHSNIPQKYESYCMTYTVWAIL